jgi:hypothetical protein
VFLPNLPSIPDINQGSSFNQWHTSNFRNTYKYEWANLGSLQNLARKLNGAVANNLIFTIPTLNVYGSTSGGYAFLGEANTRTVITRRLFKGGVAQGAATTIADITSGATSFTARNDAVAVVTAGSSGTMRFRKISSTSYDAKSVYPTGWSSQYTTFAQFAHASAGFTKNVNISIQSLSQSDLDAGFYYIYAISIKCLPDNASAFIGDYSASHRGQKYMTYLPWYLLGLPNGYSYKGTVSSGSGTVIDAETTEISTSFEVGDISETATGGLITMRGVKYNCHDLFRKAMLTIDTQLIDNTQVGLDDNGTNAGNIEYPIIVQNDPDPEDRRMVDWKLRLLQTQMFETVFENKNLWEIFLQIGRYLHAIPYLKFAVGIDKLVLFFRELGIRDTTPDLTTKLTVFNSQNMSEFNTQLDAAVTNIFSPQNIVEEWIVPKSSDSDFLINNDNAEIHLKYNISELVSFDVVYAGGAPVSIKNMVFARAVYETLSNGNPYQIIPSKGTSLFFELGSNKILGLGYVPPSVNPGTNLTAIKRVLEIAFQGQGLDWTSIWGTTAKINDFMFIVKYRTQDTLRITQFRPDIDKYFKNSSFEKYPHHETFYGQQDKIIDSERFTANLWGNLVRVANPVFQCQEYAYYGSEKEVGDLVTVGDENFYVTEVENEYYPDAIFQKVTYSKNFNQISQVVTIPSEPRYYEVSERSLVRREVRILDFVKLSTRNVGIASPYMRNNFSNMVKMMLFNVASGVARPNHAFVKFKGDMRRPHTGESGQSVALDSLFPASEVTVDGGNTTPKPPAGERSVIVPLLHFPLKNAIVFEWDMEDNFKAGDATDATNGGTGNASAYMTLQPVRYCDVLGRADLFEFVLFNKANWTLAQSRRLPFAEPTDFVPTRDTTGAPISTPTGKQIALDKDNREALSFNYQINMLYEPEFITFQNLFGQKESTLKFCLINRTVGQFDESLRLDDSVVIATVSHSFVDLGSGGINGIQINFAAPAFVFGATMDDAQAIVLYDEDNARKYPVLARNINNVENADKMNAWYLNPTFSV